MAIPVVALLGPGAVNVAIAVALSSVSALGRLSRGSTLSVRKQGYVIAARSMGASAPRIVVQDIFPNIVAPVLIRSSLNLATAVLTAAGLSFLGLGSQPPALEWGLMFSTAGGDIISSAWHLSLAAGLPILTCRHKLQRGRRRAAGRPGPQTGEAAGCQPNLGFEF